MSIYIPRTDRPQFTHQEKEWREHSHDPARAIFWEQGTGKSKYFIDNTGQLFCDGDIDGGLLCAPNGLHRNFITKEVPKHLPEDIAEKCRAFYWRCDKASTKWHQNEAREFLAYKDGLKLLAISYDGMMTDIGRKLAKEYLVNAKGRTLYGLDESPRIKNPDAARTVRVMASGPFANFRRVMTGTPIAAAPWDVQTQIKFIDENFWKPHGLDSPEAMKAAFGIWDRTARRVPIGAAQWGVLTEGGLANAPEWRKANHVAALAAAEAKGIPPELRVMYQPMGNQALKLVPTIAKNERGRPQYKNLDRLRTILDPIRSRVLKKDVFDLPPKLYTMLEFDLSPAQRRAYDSMKQLGFYMLQDRACTAGMALTLLLRLQQIACGYLVTDLEHGEEDPLVMPIEPNPRLDLMLEITEDLPHQALIWARFTHDIDSILGALKKQGKTAAGYYGALDDEQCGANEDAFHRGDVQFLVLNQAKGGEGLTLVEAKTAIYFSNSFKLLDRLQSEDRPHRWGQDVKVNNIDLVARGTVDEGIVENLLGKYDVASIVNGDVMTSWLGQGRLL